MGEKEVGSVMNALKNKILLHVFIGVSIMISSSWGCASKNARTGSLILKGNHYEKVFKKQMARSSVEEPVQDKLPKMTDEEYERLGDAYLRQGNLEKAFMHYEKALSLNSDKTRLHYKEGLLFLSKGTNEQAIKAFHHVLSKEPDHALAHEGIGQALFKKGRFEDAQKHFQQALKGNPKLWKSHNFQGIIYDYEKRPEEAIHKYHAAIELKPDEGSLYNNLGISFSLMGEYEKAAAAFREALKTSASQRKIYNNLGLVLTLLGRYGEALEAFRRGGDAAQAFNNLGCMYLHQGNYDEAVRSFEKAMELAPTFYVKAGENLRKAKTASLNKSSSLSNLHTEPNIPPPSPAPVEQKVEPTLEPLVPSEKMVYVSSSAVNIRAGASTGNKVITTAKRGDELKVLGETDAWYNVRLSNGMEGWIHKKSVK
jgi:Flp pilus assembly protein TadD